MFNALRLGGWRQFHDVDIRFHDRLTILTGANGAGKTTVLNMLSRHFGWSTAFVSTPRRTRDLVSYFADYWDGIPLEPAASDLANTHPIGEIRYSDGARAIIRVPTKVDHEYQVQLQGQRPVDGLYVSSHRPIFFHELVKTIPTEPSAREQLLKTYLNEMRSRHASGGRVQSASRRLKEALISLAVFGYGNEAVTPNDDFRATFEGFQHILRIVLPPKLGFRRLRIEMPEVVLETDTGDFSLDAVSGGVSAIFDLVWQIFMYSTTRSSFVVVIDEPENHLHPELQQTLLPSLLDAFPTSQFVVATHNPFMVTSLPDSAVFVLRFDSTNRVSSEALDMINKAATSNEILRDVLGLDFATPIWVERRLGAVVDRFNHEDLTATSFAALRAELTQLGLGRFLPETLDRLLDSGNDSTH